VVPKPKEREGIVNNIHAEIGHFSEQRILAGVKKKYFWHDKTKFVRKLA
jgi:hypothetical protein